MDWVDGCITKMEIHRGKKYFCFYDNSFSFTDIFLPCEKQQRYILHPLNTSSTHEHDYWMCNCMTRVFRSMGSDGLPTWLWDPRILLNENLSKMINMSSGVLHKPWDLDITWSNRVFLLEYESGILQHIQWYLGQVHP